jgi:hypothetical protein
LFAAICRRLRKSTSSRGYPTRWRLYVAEPGHRKIARWKD